MERTGGKVDWKSVTIRPGGLSAILSMVNMLPRYSVYGWALMVSTKNAHYSIYFKPTLGCACSGIRSLVIV